MTTLEVKAYELLKAKFGDENAGCLIQYIDEKTENGRKSRLIPY
jgi:hypothetical protein